MEMKVRLFASLKEIAGSSHVLVKIKDSAAVSDLLTEFICQYPQLQPLSKNILVSVNLEYANRSQLIRPDDEITFFPPVSGG
jgi:molybdopterin converting factor subunit 1